MPFHFPTSPSSSTMTSPGSRGFHHRHSSSSTPHLAPPSSLSSTLSQGTLVREDPSRRVWVKRPGGQPTTVMVSEDLIIDDLKSLIVRKYPTTLGRMCDPADITITHTVEPASPKDKKSKNNSISDPISANSTGTGTGSSTASSAGTGGNGKKRAGSYPIMSKEATSTTFQPDQVIFRVLDQYFPSGMAMTDAWVVDFTRPDVPDAPPSAHSSMSMTYDPHQNLHLHNGVHTHPLQGSSILSSASPTGSISQAATVGGPGGTPGPGQGHGPGSGSVAVTGSAAPMASSSSIASGSSASPVPQVDRTRPRQSIVQSPRSDPIDLPEPRTRTPTPTPAATTSSKASNGVLLLPRQFQLPKSREPRPSVSAAPDSDDVVEPEADKEKERERERASERASERVAEKGTEEEDASKDSSSTGNGANEPAKSEKVEKPQSSPENGTQDGGAKAVAKSKPANAAGKAEIAELRRSFKLNIPLVEGVVPQVNVLIVEDNLINQKILEAFMRRKKIRCSVANNGREAVQKWRQGGFHLVLMDIQLPVMSGIEATKEIRRLENANRIGVFSVTEDDTPPVPDDHLDPKLFPSPVIVVALTASSTLADKSEALAAGCNDFLTKPVNLLWLEQKTIEWGCMQALIDFEGWKNWAGQGTPRSASSSISRSRSRSRPRSKSKRGMAPVVKALTSTE